MKARSLVGCLAVAWLVGAFLRVGHMVRGPWIYWFAPVWLVACLVVLWALYCIGFELVESRRIARRRRQDDRARKAFFSALESDFARRVNLPDWRRPGSRHRL